jgi:hypothetical protein
VRFTRATDCPLGSGGWAEPPPIPKVLKGPPGGEIRDRFGGGGVPPPSKTVPKCPPWGGQIGSEVLGGAPPTLPTLVGNQ